MRLRRPPPRLVGLAPPGDRLRVVLETGLTHHAEQQQQQQQQQVAPEEAAIDAPGGYFNPYNWFYSDAKTKKDFKRMPYWDMTQAQQDRLQRIRGGMINELKDLQSSTKAGDDNKAKTKARELAIFEYKYHFSEDMPECWGKATCK